MCKIIKDYKRFDRYDNNKEIPYNGFDDLRPFDVLQLVYEDGTLGEKQTVGCDPFFYKGKQTIICLDEEEMNKFYSHFSDLDELVESVDGLVSALRRYIYINYINKLDEDENNENI